MYNIMYNLTIIALDKKQAAVDREIEEKYAKSIGISIEVESLAYVINFIDFQLNINNKTFYPFIKPDIE